MVVTMLAGGPLADCLGGKWLLLGVALVSCLCTALVPILAPINITLVAVVQVSITTHISIFSSRTMIFLHRWLFSCTHKWATLGILVVKSWPPMQ